MEVQVFQETLSLYIVQKLSVLFKRPRICKCEEYSVGRVDCMFECELKPKLCADLNSKRLTMLDNDTGERSRLHWPSFPTLKTGSMPSFNSFTYVFESIT